MIRFDSIRLDSIDGLYSRVESCTQAFLDEQIPALLLSLLNSDNTHILFATLLTLKNIIQGGAGSCRVVYSLSLYGRSETDIAVQRMQFVSWSSSTPSPC